MAFVLSLPVGNHSLSPSAGSLRTSPRTAPLYRQRQRTAARASIASSQPHEKTDVVANTPTPLHPAEEFLLSLGISKEDCRRALSRLPRLKTHDDLARQSQPMLRYLKNELQLSKRQVARVVRNAPHILFRGTDEFAERLGFLETVARIADDDRASAIAQCPHVLWMNLTSAAEVVNIVVEACPLISPTALGVIFGRVPQALVTAPKSIRTNIEFIRSAGVRDGAAIGRILSKVPLALVYDVKKSMAKRIQVLSKEFGFSDQTIGKVLVSTPEVLEWSVAKVIKPQVSAIASLVGVDAVASVVDKVPSILGVHDMLDRVLWLRDEVGLDDEQIRTVIREAPAVLTYSVIGNLAPKWAFVQGTMHGTAADIVKAPRETLCANLQQRAMPRYAFLVSSGIFGHSVFDILRGSDIEFCNNVAQCDPEKFRTYVDNDTYLLFFSQLL